MFLDNVVIAGLITVGGTLVFMLGILVFVYQDSHRKKDQGQRGAPGK